MITLFTTNTPNGHKIAIALEELVLPYEVRTLDLSAGEQFAADFVRLSPNGKVPVIIDVETDQVVYESNAILLYLADKAGRLIPQDPQLRMEAIQLLFFQAASIGPMFGQRAYFTMFAPDKPQSAVDRYMAEGSRLEAVLERLLEDRDYFVREYSIVDISIFGWLNATVAARFPIDAHPRLRAWFARVAERPAVQRGIAIPAPLIDFTPFRSAAA